MQKKIFLALLYLSLLWEAAIAGLALFATETFLVMGKFTVTEQMLNFGTLFGWLILFLTILIGYIIYLVHKGERTGWQLTGLLATWWVAIGVGVYVQLGVPDNLISDSLKGVLLLIFAYLSLQYRKPA
jgi:hypothetical protein